MKIILSPDSFKESMSAREACEAMTRGIYEVWPDAEVVALPVADGGEGFGEVLVEALEGELIAVPVTGPRGERLDAHLGWIERDATAIVESAQACGLDLVPTDQRDPRKTTTGGVGDLIAAALDRGATTIILGLGGSATNDLGAGMLDRLGVKFLDDAGGRVAIIGGGSLEKVSSVDVTGLDPRLATATVIAASDVDNPLTGKNGASAIFGPQKGATAEIVQELDEHLGRVGRLLEDALDRTFIDSAGAGAAGGLGAAVLGPLHGELKPGIDIVLDAWDFDGHVRAADLVLTGEGSIDGQTATGKAPWGVAGRARDAGVPVVAFAGKLGDGHDTLDRFDAIMPIVAGIGDLEDALANGPDNLAAATARACALIALEVPRTGVHHVDAGRQRTA